MSTPMLVISIALLVCSVFLVVAVLLQQGKSHNLSGTIAGGAETFFGKSKATTLNKKLSILTTVVSIIFVLLVASVYIMQDNGDASDYNSFWEMIVGKNEDVEETTALDETTAADTTSTADTTAADADVTSAE